MQNREDYQVSVSSPNGRWGIDNFTTGFVRKSARRLAGKHGFRYTDRDEIEQQLYLKLAKHLGAADSDSPRWKAFVAKTVRRHLASMIRDNRAEKRDHRRTGSIHDNIGTNDAPVELGETLSERARVAHRGSAIRDTQELAELCWDLAGCLAELRNERLRDVCERLKHASVSQVARDLDIPRTTLNGWLAKVRRHFERRELKDYL